MYLFIVALIENNIYYYYCAWQVRQQNNVNSQ